ncbi:MAG: efflux transporter outer membrane subunit [Desulfobulbaceae bacterium]|nr:efflux transporter outer membrane subunit [Desulfobulbaceae bacterium]
MLKQKIILIMLTMALSACMVGPDYHPPQMETPYRWSGEARGVVADASNTVSHWWTLFCDPELNSLIDRAVLANKNLQITEARILEARARRGIVAADAWPAVDFSGAYSRSRRSENNSAASGSSGAVGAQDLFQTGFDAGWEIDIFGGVRRAVEAADAGIAVEQENRRDVLVTLLAEVARNYLELRGSQRRIVTALENIESQQQTLELTQGRFAAGLSSKLDVAQAEAQLATTEAQIPGLETAAREAVHRLGVLAGVAPTALLKELTGDSAVLCQPAEVPVDLPSELLRRRPDIRRAERELAAATAMVGVATAELFPRFSFSGLLGLQSANLSDLVSSGSRYWSIGPALNWPLFAAGRIRAGIAVQNARQQQALLSYEQMVLTALEEVENALVAYDGEQTARRALEHAVDANRRASSIADELYRTGLVDFLNVLQSQQALYLSQDQFVQSEQRVLINLVALFKALGGGWQLEELGNGGPSAEQDGDAPHDGEPSIDAVR